MNYLVEIEALRETDKGTEMIVLVPAAEVADKILKYRHCGKIEADLLIDDKRRLSNDQRRKIYAIIGDISNHTGHAADFLKEYFKFMFIGTVNTDYFSLSRRKDHAASVEIARQFITYLIDFCFKWEVGTRDTLLNQTDDVDTYLYLAIKYRQCCICGKPNADIHHEVGVVGMGRNRKTIDDSKSLKISLCRQHHNIAHDIGIESFRDKYHVYGVEADEKNFKDWNEI